MLVCWGRGPLDDCINLLDPDAPPSITAPQGDRESLLFSTRAQLTNCSVTALAGEGRCTGPSLLAKGEPR